MTIGPIGLLGVHQRVIEPLTFEAIDGGADGAARCVSRRATRRELARAPRVCRERFAACGCDDSGRSKAATPFILDCFERHVTGTCEPLHAFFFAGKPEDTTAVLEGADVPLPSRP